MTPNPRKINRSRFYFEWKGHQIQDLETFHAITTAHRPDKPIVYLAGDSSLDNKYWVSSDPAAVDVPEIYHHALDKPSPKPDVAFWLNSFLGEKATCINTAVEYANQRITWGKRLSTNQGIQFPLVELHTEAALVIGGLRAA